MALSSVLASYVLWAVVTLVGVRVVYELLLSPLRQFPGPLLARFTFYRAGITLTGRLDHWKRAWHRRWGPAVRVGPNAISLSDPDLIKVIYTTKNAWLKVRTVQNYTPPWLHCCTASDGSEMKST
jgi:hypothetical protein